MQTIAAQLEAAFRQAIHDAFNLDADPLIAPSQNAKFGDYQSNAAMGLSKRLSQETGQKTNPRQVAQSILDKLNLKDMTTEAPAIAGPGFINITLSQDWVARQLAIVAKDARLGIESAARPQTVVIDYSGPNVAKQMHIGHLRSTNIGDALARILEFQKQSVLRQNHIGDWGTQFGMLIQRKIELGADTGQIEDLETEYRQAKERFDADPAFADQARKRVVELQGGSEEIKKIWRIIVDESRAHFQPLYERMNVSLRPEDERGESFYNDQLAQTVKELRDKGVAVESQGAVVIFIEGYEAPLIIQKSDGGFGYATTDLAALRYRVRELHAERVIYVTDSRQSQHFAQVFAAARMAGWVDGVELDHAQFGSILGADGKPMKTRAGETVKLKAVLDEAEKRAMELVNQKSADLDEPTRQAIARAVGIGAVKYFDLNKDRAGDYIFDWQKMLAMDGNTAPYLQYAYARIQSIFRKTDEQPARTFSPTDPHELALAKHLLRLGEVIELVARELKPHHLCNYLYELSARFSGFYENCPVLQSDPSTRTARLALCRLAGDTLAKGLDLLGIDHPERM